MVGRAGIGDWRMNEELECSRDVLLVVCAGVFSHCAFFSVCYAVMLP